MPQSKTEWLALDYSLPANPSRARVYVWRRLKSLGAQQLRPGMAVLPNTRENAVQFEALAEKVRALLQEAGLEVKAGGAYDGFSHWVEQAVTRDIAVAKRTN